MRPKTFAISVIVFIGVAIIIIVAMYSLTPNKNNNSAVTPTAELTDNSSKLIGYVYSSGLQTGYQYQLTYINYTKSTIVPANIMQSLDGVFLIGDETSIASYWGKCVEVNGLIPPGQDGTVLSDNYYRANLVVQSIEPSNDCMVSFNNYSDTVTPTDTYTGTIARNNRPFPDIGYDYKIILNTPYMDKNSASGLDQTVTEVVLVPMTNDVFTKLQQNVGKVAGVSGVWHAGFADSNFFLVTAVN